MEWIKNILELLRRVTKKEEWVKAQKPDGPNSCISLVVRYKYVSFKINLPNNRVSLLTKIGLAIAGTLISSCASLPSTDHKTYTFPVKDAFVGEVDKPHKKLGLVRAKVNYVSLDPTSEERDLCRNYFNQAVRDLIKFSKAKGGDGVVSVKSVVFLEDGRTEKYDKAECADDGMEGQVLAEGMAVKWAKEPVTPQIN